MSFHSFGKRQREIFSRGGEVAGAGETTGFRRRLGFLPCGAAVLLAAVCFIMACPAFGQVVPTGERGGMTVSAGATASGYYLQYGERKILGATGFVDVDRSRFGIEAETRWLRFYQTDDVYATTWEIGPRYHMTFGRFQPYAKGMVGIGDFNFPYNLAHGSYLVVAPGAGVDFRLNRRIDVRVADFEYQYWPQFTYGTMTSYGVSTGIRVRIF